MAEDNFSKSSKETLPTMVERFKSFRKWPFKKDAKCTPIAMAEAGWISTSVDSKSPAAKCKICLKELDGWERTDDPWDEHVKHSPECRFVLLNKKDDWTVADQLYLIEGRFLKLGELELQKKLDAVRKKQDIVREQIKKHFNITED